MTKTELIAEMAEKSNLSKKDLESHKISTFRVLLAPSYIIAVLLHALKVFYFFSYLQ